MMFSHEETICSNLSFRTVGVFLINLLLRKSNAVPAGVWPGTKSWPVAPPNHGDSGAQKGTVVLAWPSLLSVVVMPERVSVPTFFRVFDQSLKTEKTLHTDIT